MECEKIKKVLLFANTDWYLYNFRLPLAKAIRERGCEVVLVSPPGDYGERLLKEGFRWIPLPMERRSLNPFREMFVILRLARIYRREKPGIVHHFTIKSLMHGSIAARLAGVRRAVNAVDGLGYVFTNQGWKAKLLRPFVKGILKTVLRGEGIRLIVQNPDDGEQFIQNQLVDAKVVRLVRGAGVDTSRFVPTRIEKQNTRITVLMASRLLWDKGVQEYVDAARNLIGEGLDIEFLLAGSSDEGNPAAIPNSQVQAWQTEGVVKALGHVEDMKGLFSYADLVVLPSYREGVPSILIEAAACGLPIVTTDVPGCREVVVHGKNGMLAPPRDSESLAEAIKLLALNPQKRREFGMAGREIAVQEFDVKRVIDDTLAVYAELYDGESPRAFDGKQLPAFVSSNPTNIG
jgi:glycosyltransferase involved in cell wall biosynthesis